MNACLSCINKFVLDEGLFVAVNWFYFFGSFGSPKKREMCDLPLE